MVWKALNRFNLISKWKWHWMRLLPLVFYIVHIIIFGLLLVLYQMTIGFSLFFCYKSELNKISEPVKMFHTLKRFDFYHHQRSSKSHWCKLMIVNNRNRNRNWSTFKTWLNWIKKCDDFVTVRMFADYDLIHMNFTVFICILFN